MNSNWGNMRPGTETSGVLTRLLASSAGNVMPVMAAAIFPLAAMIGGSVDLSRIYMTQTRLQQACDTGALATRRAMSGLTPTTADIAEGYKFFDFNFPSGSFGGTTLSRSYAAGATAGTIVGSASIHVPATIMKLFGKTDYTVDVTCTSTLNIPNTDIMFVLDTSGSMAQTISGDSTTKIAALKQAVKDFYTELGAGEATGPGRIRYGFVPYSGNVNVGRLVPTSYFRDTAPYQSRSPVTSDVWAYTLGAESAIGAYGAWNPSTTPTLYNNSTGFGTFSTLGTNANTTVTVGSTSYTYKKASATSSATCSALNNLSGSSSTLIAREDLAGTITGPALASTTNDPPTYVGPGNPSAQTLTYDKTDPRTVRGYRYRWQRVSGTNGCWLERSSVNYNRIQSATSTKAIVWTQVTKVTGWTYQQRTLDVSGLKNGTNWNASFSVADINTTTASYTLSGSSTSSTINVLTPTTVTWTGCVEEASTINTIVPTSAIAIPTTAYDMQVDLIPSDDTRRWRPLLQEVVWDRLNSNQWQGQVSGWQSNGWAVCPGQASKLAQYTSDVVSGLSTSFAAYVDALPILGGTQHDIGMIWGARFLSPDGIFSASNSDASAPGGFQIGRHIVFMTDGTMDARNQGYGPWGISQMDGRQVPTNAQDTDNGSSQMNDVHYRRMEMICNAAKSKGYTIWVVGFGIASLPTALANCATDSDHAAVASNSTALRQKFQAIAETIGGLRLSQ
jgi:Flp pilus assembly protein TadG